MNPPLSSHTAAPSSPVPLPRRVPPFRTYRDQLYLEWRSERTWFAAVAAAYLLAFLVLYSRVGVWSTGVPIALYTPLGTVAPIWLLAYTYESIKREWESRAAYVLLTAPVSPWAVLGAKLTVALTGYTLLGAWFTLLFRTLLAADVPPAFAATFLSSLPAIAHYGLMVLLGTWTIAPVVMLASIARYTVHRYGGWVLCITVALIAAAHWAVIRLLGGVVEWKVRLPSLVVAIESSEAQTMNTGVGPVNLWWAVLTSALGVTLVVLSVWLWRRRVQVADGGA